MTFIATFTNKKGNRIIFDHYFPRPGASVVIENDDERAYFEASPEFSVADEAAESKAPATTEPEPAASDDQQAEPADAPATEPEVPGSEPAGTMTTADLPEAAPKARRSRKQ